MTSPLLASFIIERATDPASGEQYTLANFGNMKIAGSMSYNNGTFLISPHTFDNVDNMYNQGNNNINLTNISYGAFNETYQNSVGTQNTCSTIPKGDQTIPYSCRLADTGVSTGIYQAPQNVIVNSPAIVTIPNSISLQIHTSNYHLLVKSGAGVLIKSGGKLSLK